MYFTSVGLDYLDRTVGKNTAHLSSYFFGCCHIVLDIYRTPKFSQYDEIYDGEEVIPMTLVTCTDWDDNISILRGNPQIPTYICS